MRTSTSFLAGLGVGVAVMFMLDPERGHRRRRLMKDQVIRTRIKLQRTSRRVGDTVGGLRESARSIMGAGKLGDAALMARVRLSVAHSTSHPRAIVIGVQNGVVGLSGPILAGEVDELLRTISGISGITRVENNLEAHPTADVPALQGASERVA